MAADPLLPLALRVSEGEPVDWPSALATLDEKDREAAAVLAELVRLFDLDTVDAPRDEPELDIRWGSYVLEQRLGGGSFGEVYRARDPRLERTVAVKIFRVKEARNRAEVLREGRLLARVRHPNVAVVHGVEEHGERAGLVMELVEGETLAEIVARRGALSAREAALVGVDLCRALAALHHARVLHRDVKPENVLREAGGRTVLVDLGVGLELSEVEKLRQVAGTPLYLAPELLTGEPPAVASDLYALGVLLFFLVSTRHPAEAETLDELRGVHREKRYLTLRDARPDVPWSFAQLVAECLAPEPGQRPRSAGELERRLIAILDPAKRTAGRRWWPAVAGALFVVALIATTIVLLSRGQARGGVAGRLVVGELVNASSEALFEEVPRTLLRLALENSRGLVVLSREDERTKLQEMTRAIETAIAGPVGLQLCQRAGFDLLLGGEVRSKGTGYELRLEGRDCRNGALMLSETADFAATSELPAAVDRLTTTIRQKIGTSAREDERAPPLAEATTPSLRALELYTQALDTQLAGDYVGAEHLLELAVETDPGFALAHAQLAVCRNGLGDLEGALAAAEAAFEWRGRTSERERRRIEIAYHLDRLQYEDALDAAEKLTALFPKDAEAQRQLAHLHARLGRPHDAASAARRAAELRPELVPLGTFAGYQSLGGDLEGALATCRRARELHGNEPSYLDWVEGAVQLQRGDLESAHEAFTRLAGAGNVYTGASAHLLALTEALAGRLDAARQHLLANAAGRAGEDFWARRDRRLGARLALLAGDRAGFERLLRPFTELPALPISLRDLRAAALLWSDAGNRDEVARIAERVAQISEHYPSTFSRVVALQLEAESLRLAGDLAGADAVLESARKVWWGDAELLLSELRLADATGEKTKAHHLRRLLVEERKVEMIEAGYGLEWQLLRERLDE